MQPRSTEEIDAELNAMRDEWEEHQLALEKIQEEARRAGGNSSRLAFVAPDEKRRLAERASAQRTRPRPKPGGVGSSAVVVFAAAAHSGQNPDNSESLFVSAFYERYSFEFPPAARLQSVDVSGPNRPGHRSGRRH